MALLSLINPSPLIAAVTLNHCNGSAKSQMLPPTGLIDEAMPFTLLEFDYSGYQQEPSLNRVVLFES